MVGHLTLWLAVPLWLLRAFATSTTEESNTTSTTTVPEFSYYVGDWSSCSTTCESGTRQREVFCYRTCSNPRLCTSGVTDWHCSSLVKPMNLEVCFGAAPVCPPTTTATFTSSTTRTLTTSTATVVTVTTTQGVQEGWECAPLGSSNCFQAAQCGAQCPCCRRITTQVSFISPTTTTREAELDDSSGLLIVLIIALIVVLVCIVGFAVIGWRYYATKPKTRQKPQKPRSQVAHGPEAQARTYGARQTERIHQDEKTVFDRKLGRGVPSAAPDGFFDEPPDWEEEAPKTASPPSPRSAFSRAFSHSAFETDRHESVKSSPRRRRQAEPDRKPDVHNERPSPTAPSGTLPPGYASAARRNRREGKEPPDFAEDLPGQANGESSHTKGSSEEQEDGERGQKKPKEQEKADKDSPRGPSGRSKSGARDATNPRVAADTAAAPEAADLIGRVDYELDQSQCKDLETRRRIFKNLILKWHPDKNQEEVLAAEVFRHLMARRGRYLEA